MKSAVIIVFKVIYKVFPEVLDAHMMLLYVTNIAHAWNICDSSFIKLSGADGCWLSNLVQLAS